MPPLYLSNGLDEIGFVSDESGVDGQPTFDGGCGDGGWRRQRISPAGWQPDAPQPDRWYIYMNSASRSQWWVPSEGSLIGLQAIAQFFEHSAHSY